MYLTYNGVVVESFIKILNNKIYTKKATNVSKSYRSYLNKLVNKYNNTSHRSIYKKPTDPDYSALTEEIKTNSKSPKFKVCDRIKITKYKNVFSKGYIENWLRGIFAIDTVLKSNP